MGKIELTKYLAVVVEICGGRELSKMAKKLMVNELSKFDEEKVFQALHECQSEFKGQLSLSDIISRIDDGRPNNNAAFAMLPRSEAESVLWTQEMAEAHSETSHLVNETGRRMAFNAVYDKRVKENKRAGCAAVWSVSLGHDENHRDEILLKALESNLIDKRYALMLSPHLDKTTQYQMIESGRNRKLKALVGSVESAKNS